jgi:predicted RNA methylase
MCEAFGGTDAEGAWQWKDAYEAVEVALVRFVQQYSPALAKMPLKRQLLMLERLHGFCPTHTRRSDESQAMQQFSTPMTIGISATLAADIAKGEVVLEPSAGTGMLAVLAQMQGASLVLNELSEARLGLLHGLFPKVPLSRHNAEYINDYLDVNITPDVVIMNPPFSSSPNSRSNSTSVTLTHIRSALARLRDGGRLVAITSESFSPYAASWKAAFAGLQERATLRYSIPIAGSLYAKHGTNTQTRLHVFDKTPAENPAAFKADHAMVESPTELLEAVQSLRHASPRLMRATALSSSVEALPLFASAHGSLSAAQPARHSPVMANPALVSASSPASSSRTVMELSYGTRDLEQDATALSDGIYEPYSVQSIVIEGTKAHPSPLVQSAAMASVLLPKPSYRPHIYAHLLHDGILSDAQLESVIYAGEAHNAYLSGHYKRSEHGDHLIAAKADDAEARQYRRGWYLGDGTGCGKGRQVAGIVLDNWLKGRKRAVWLSKSDALLEDAKRDWAALGGNALDVIPQWKFKQGGNITLTEGILFTTYATLRSSGRGNKKSRLDQITDWLGDDFDGCIMFDEAHAMANAVSSKGNRGKKAASQQGLCGLKLQYALPDARVVYISATGATTVSNLAYAQRLGLWATADMPFDNQVDFVAQMEKGGIAAMEVISRDLKAMGLYLARSISYAGVEYEFLEHHLTHEQIRIYDEYADAFAIIHHNIEAALKATNITSAEGKTRNGNAKSAVRSAFESNKQRFFNHLIMAMKCPTMIKAMEADIAAGHAVVIQIVSTNEALMERRLSEISPSEWNDLHIDITPREYVFDYLRHAFPVHLHVVVTDAEGNETTELAKDEEGNLILCLEAVRKRDALLERLACLPALPSALDQIIHHFGHEQVAEATGRSRRVIKIDDRYCVQNRPASSNTAETHAFMDDKKKILIFSEAGGTGRSYHADRNAINQRRRIHYLLEAGWKADAAIQGLGRTNRTNQVHTPVFRPVATDVKGEKRFLSTIARRLDTLGAITRGQRETGSQGLFREEDNLESVYARAALRDLFTTIAHGKLECCPLQAFEDATGLKLHDNEGLIKQELPPVSQFLNRVLALRIELQNALFDEFEMRIITRIEQAKEGGYFEVGVETLKADGFSLIEQKPLYTHQGTDSITMCNHIERRDRVTPMQLQDALERCADYKPRLVRNNTSGRVAICISTRGHVDEQGALIPRVSLIRPLTQSAMNKSDFEESGWEELDYHSFAASWNEEVATAPTHRTSQFYLITGVLLPVWKRLQSDKVQVCRLQTDDGSTLLGRMVDSSQIHKVFANFGLDNSQNLTPELIITHVLGSLTPYRFGNGMELRSSTVMGNQRLELVGFREGQKDRLKAIGFMGEIISYRYRMFVPLGENAPHIVSQIAELV